MVHNIKDGVEVELTADELSEYNARQTAWDNASADRKLFQIRKLRNEFLQNSDWKVTSAKEQGTNLSTSFKNWRQGLRDLPSTYTTESEYDELLARDENGNLAHSVWSE